MTTLIIRLINENEIYALLKIEMFLAIQTNYHFIIIIIIIGSIPRRAFQYLFTSDTFDRLSIFIKTTSKEINKKFRCSTIE